MVEADEELRDRRLLLVAEVHDVGHALQHLLDLPRQPAEDREVRPEDLHGQVRPAARDHVVDAVADRLAEVDRDSGNQADGSAHLLVLAFESADHEVQPKMARAFEIALDHGGRIDPAVANADAVNAWRNAFIRMPYFRELITPWAVINDTFETAITWERFPDFHRAVMHATESAIEAATGRRGLVTCRFTHVYPDGPAPYYTVLAPARRGGEAEQWDEIKAAVSEAVLAAGGTITHHHAVGRDHRPWYDRQRPDRFADALVAAKRALDPSATLNPGVLVDPAIAAQGGGTGEYGELLHSLVKGSLRTQRAASLDFRLDRRDVDREERRHEIVQIPLPTVALPPQLVVAIVTVSR